MFSCTGMGSRDSSLDLGFGFCSLDSGADLGLATESACHSLIYIEEFSLVLRQVRISTLSLLAECDYSRLNKRRSRMLIMFPTVSAAH